MEKSQYLWYKELFSPCLALSPKGAVGPLFVWLSPFQLTCLALMSYSAFAKGKVHARLIGKIFISIAGAHLNHFWDKMMLHTFGEKVPGANIESSFQAPADMHNSSSEW